MFCLATAFLNYIRKCKYRLSANSVAFAVQSECRQSTVPAVYFHLSSDSANKSQENSDADEYFIRPEIQRPLKDIITELLNSSWKAQVLVTNNKTHKKRMILD